MHRPKLLILDEPSSALDPLMQNILYELIREASARGSTVFMSSHNLTEVEKVCGRVAIIRKGKIVTLENIDDLKSKWLHALKVSFVNPIDKSIFVTDDVEVAQDAPDTLSIKIRGDIQPVLQKLGQYKIRNLDVGRASLEDIFLEYYDA
jgi:ABC-2 type transport system ATP-binding protein